VIDCCDRNIIDWRFSTSGSAKVATAALEDAFRARKIQFGVKNNLAIHSDNGLVFGSKEFTKVARGFNLSQEFITPYTPEQNGMRERFF
jgi:putative transposase